ncbi:DUF2867 domain-containing protein [Aestuariibius sp. 2305UL40-4]|uniref:DUF2867 domain-containing protein n=1 Tax=Aestuariibius violaceus TaxID=3234132 RepID=UPI00345ECAC4
MPHVREVPLPAESALQDRMRAGDFIDCYAVASALPLEEAARRATAFPGWAKGLLALRNAIVAPLGLRTRLAGDGDRIGPFPVTSRSDTELILGLDDRHLDFRISLLRTGPDLHMATWVHTHNAFGRTYLRIVMPFHRAICRQATARMAG